MPTPLTKTELDRAAVAGCQTPGCTHEDHDGTIYLHARCHPGGGIEARYKLYSGVVHIACKKCKKTVADIAVQGIVGATGEGPTSDDPTDKGGLNAALTIEGDRVRLHFGKAVAWLDMTPEGAMQFAAALVDRANLIQAGKS